MGLEVGGEIAIMGRELDVMGVLRGLSGATAAEVRDAPRTDS